MVQYQPEIMGYLWACTDELPSMFQEIDLEDIRMYLGFSYEFLYSWSHMVWW